MKIKVPKCRIKVLLARPSVSWMWIPIKYTSTEQDKHFNIYMCGTGEHESQRKYTQLLAERRTSSHSNRCRFDRRWRWVYSHRPTMINKLCKFGKSSTCFQLGQRITHATSAPHVRRRPLSANYMRIHTRAHNSCLGLGIAFFANHWNHFYFCKIFWFSSNRSRAISGHSEKP